jgi:SAM-dependent methyltransferase
MPLPNDRAAQTAQVHDSYATLEALAIYRKRVDQGLRIWEAAVVHQHFPPRGRVLTLGCGAGRETFALEQLGYDTAGVDISQPLLEIAGEIGQQRRHRASFCLIDGETVPFGDDSFDVVTLWAQMLGDVPSRAARLALMREVRRVLVPAGLATWSVQKKEIDRMREAARRELAQARGAARDAARLVSTSHSRGSALVDFLSGLLS